ncbi:Nramp family divalent metal transporter [Zeaxanthinibacter enoshimensis]|uniref:NRAMP (Natural resistance-associated macrophage protein)-like metal ion transporter n=1 Tax=Zeaxanthinibacter enoshimensis TaxID=392009 RepID=A0A4V3D3U2_9FLAO|nr:Nramp family divalent metal transporter [Zeaxanthinibacter enoshimensis]TDQ31283.1 NRAMP (natural resistance-associated macrophage protein)-like metal ion transporter [Zeaxanthinibacter enoshimensis]
MFKNIGPGVLVAAAFIGPGTVTVCTLAGVGFGYALLWTLLLSTLATMVLQEMSARLGLVTRNGLADVIREQLNTPLLRNLVLFIVLGAIVIGNTAYEAGNIGGATLGLEAIFGNNYSSFYPWVIGISAFFLLLAGNYKLLEKVFVTLVLLMSVSFIITAVITKPDLGDVFRGLLVPGLPEGSLLMVIALVGTTVVPYNLFLHASLVNEKWNGKEDLGKARNDTLWAVGLGGLVSMTIVIAASAIPTTEVNDALDLAKGLQPLFGEGARYFMGLGLFAAGITSSITAPLAAAYVANSCFGWQADMKDWKFRLVWISVLTIGVLSLSFGFRPIEIIKFAQVANGLLLPVIAIFLLWVVNKASVLGRYKNGVVQNIIAVVIIGLAILLGAKSIITVFNA